MADEPTNPEKNYRDLEDLSRAIRAVAEYFHVDRVYVIGSQAILANNPDVPAVMRLTPEIDIYPEGVDKRPEGDVSEQIAALFGEASQFYKTHGFFIDGVDKTTAKLPDDWEGRAHRHQLDVYGRAVEVVTPDEQDLAISKMARLAYKDKTWLRAFHQEIGLKPKTIAERLERTPIAAEQKKAAMNFVEQTVGRTRSRDRGQGM